jgi:hypothetical protein
LENQTIPTQQQNNNTLKTLCLLSYFWTGVSLLFLIGVFVFAFLLVGSVDKFSSELRQALHGGSYETDSELRLIVLSYFISIISGIITLIGVIVMHKKNEIGLIIYAIGELAIYAYLFFSGGLSKLAFTLEGSSGGYSGLLLVYGSLAIVLAFDILFIFLYKRALEKTKGKLFLNFAN